MPVAPAHLLERVVIPLADELHEDNAYLHVRKLLEDMEVHGVVGLGGGVAVGQVGELGDDLLEDRDTLVGVPGGLGGIQVEHLNAA